MAGYHPRRGATAGTAAGGLQGTPAKRRSKYGNRKTSDGYDSQREARRARDLRLLQQAGKIADLQEQVRYELIPKQDGERACHYVADFVYRDEHGTLIVEDTKGMRTADYVIKRKLMQRVHGIRIREV